MTVRTCDERKCATEIHCTLASTFRVGLALELICFLSF